jgi:predicted GH43/DUF377 family glycosyl hydrolase
VTAELAVRQEACLYPDSSRVVARLFLPGEELHQSRSRTAQIVERVMALPEHEVVDLAAELLADFSPRHHDYAQLLVRHASIVRAHVGEDIEVSGARTAVLGASFTAEYATEGAALCNPSAVLHPDQSHLSAGQVRVAVSLRCIGEGHLSSIGFCSAVVDPKTGWTFETRTGPTTTGTVTPAQWGNRPLTSLLAAEQHPDELTTTLLRSLPDRFARDDLEIALAGVHHDLLMRPGAAETVGLVRRLVASAYDVDFGAEVALDQRVLLPSAPDESNGMEDARFTRFVGADGCVEYRATYTAYDGQRIAPRLLTSPDLRRFRARRLAGPAARNKGMALFPRTVDHRHLALCRSDGERTGLASSADGVEWSAEAVLQSPSTAWDLLQVGNCGPPIETERGWLVLTHGVGPMRTYAIGAMLLDLDDPRRVLGRLARPLLEPTAGERDGYVPNVVYSCGAFLHDDVLWLPFGIGDARIAVARAGLDDVLDAMTSRV